MQVLNTHLLSLTKAIILTLYIKKRSIFTFGLNQQTRCQQSFKTYKYLLEKFLLYSKTLEISLRQRYKT